MSAREQQNAMRRVIHSDEFIQRDCCAALLVLVFGQQIENVAALTWDDVTINDDMVTIRIGEIDIALPDPLDVPWRLDAVNPGKDMTASHPKSNWVFRGSSPGRHISPQHLRFRLKLIFATRAARLGTLHELTKLAPVAILADALGYHPTTIERHAVDSAASYAGFIEALRQPRPVRPSRA